MAFLNEQGLAKLWSHILNKLNKKISLPEEGSSYKQLVTDGNGETVWEDRLAYTELENVTILPENTYTSKQATVVANYSLIENQVYTITYNGNVYNSTAIFDENYGICLGNLSKIGLGSDTTEPFVLFLLAPREVGYIMFSDSVDSRTLSVFGPTETNTIISGKYLPGNLQPGEGYNSVVVGDASSATGTRSLAIGSYTEASGEGSVAEGLITKAQGIYSHAEGENTIASGEAQHAQGKYNIEDTENKYAHIVGNGTAYNARSNAHTVDWDGNAWFAGTIKVGGTDQDDENAKEIALKSDIEAVSEKIVEPTGAHQQFVTNGEGESTWEERLGYSTIENIMFVDGQGGFNVGNNMHMYFYNSIYEMINGESYEVVIDGQSYTSVAVLDQEDNNYFYLGNLSLMGVGDNTGESFLFMTMGPLSSTFTAYIRNTSTTVPSLQITGPLKIIHKIPSEYTHGNLVDGEGHFSTQSYYSTATGDSAVALGNGTKSTSQSSVAIGGYTEANGQYSLGAGYQTKANGNYSVVTGKYNIVDEENKYSNIVGNGDSNSARSNAHTIDWDGIGWFAGGIKIGGAGQDDEAAQSVILAPNTASAGQALVVKSVDENGKPIDWEAEEKTTRVTFKNTSGTITCSKSMDFLLNELLDISSASIDLQTPDADGNYVVYHCTGWKILSAVFSPDYTTIVQYIVRFDFGDNIAPIIADYINKTIVFDPDWDGIAWFSGGIKIGGTNKNDPAAIDVALKSDTDDLAERITSLESKNSFIITYSPSSKTYICSISYEELFSAPYDSINFYYYDTLVTVNGEVSKGNFMESLNIRHNINMNTGNGYFDFTFMKHDRSGYMILRLNSDNTIEKLNDYIIPTNEYVSSQIDEVKSLIPTTATQIGAAPENHASADTTYGVSSETNYGHAMASSTTPKANGTASVGSETTKFARGDHIHPAQTSVSGNAGTATKLATERTISLTGDASGSVAFDGSDDVSITVMVTDDSHNHIIDNIDGLSTELAGKVPTSRTVNGKALTGDISLNASDVGAAVTGDITNAISAHNSSETSHTDIRGLISALDTRLTTLANSDDTTLDQMSEVVEYIKDNRDLIDGITTSKVSVSDIIDNLTTSDAKKPLSAKQGVALKAEIDTKVTAESGKGLSTNDYTTAEKNKLSGIAEGAEVNQNAFSSVVIGSTTITADTKTDTLTISVGDNITVTPDSTNDTITISAVDTTYDAITDDEIDAICG